MQVTYKLQLGENEFTLTTEVANEIDFFQKMSFYSSLPKTGPKGETDLKVVHRTTSKGDYYSLVSETAGQEFRFGVLREGGLFPKGWAPIYKAGSETNSEDETSTATTVSSTNQSGGVTAAQVTTNETPKARPTASSLLRTRAATSAGAPATTNTQSSGTNTASDIINKYDVRKTAAAGQAKPVGSVNMLLRR